MKQNLGAIRTHARLSQKVEQFLVFDTGEPSVREAFLWDKVSCASTRRIASGDTSLWDVRAWSVQNHRRTTAAEGGKFLRPLILQVQTQRPWKKCYLGEKQTGNLSPYVFTALCPHSPGVYLKTLPAWPSTPTSDQTGPLCRCFKLGNSACVVNTFLILRFSQGFGHWRQALGETKACPKCFSLLSHSVRWLPQALEQAEVTSPHGLWPISGSGPCQWRLQNRVPASREGC